ncbi:MAG TPA: hypothetical protein VGJ00_04440 [Rhabdochlamydiaceae bacterium]|jgi:hypothetical protein
MAEPIPTPFPPPENQILFVRELRSHVDKLSSHLENLLGNFALVQQENFLKDFSENVQALSKLLQGAPFQAMALDLKEEMQEATMTLTQILNQSVENLATLSQMSMADAIKNYTQPSVAESDLSLFLFALEKYPESCRILIQELHLISQDLGKRL